MASYKDWVYVITGNGVDDTHKNLPAPTAPAIAASFDSIKERQKELEAESRTVEEDLRQRLLLLPNLPHPDAPIGGEDVMARYGLAQNLGDAARHCRAHALGRLRPFARRLLADDQHGRVVVEPGLRHRVGAQRGPHDPPPEHVPRRLLD